MGGEWNQVVPFVLEMPPLGQPVGRGVLVIGYFDIALAELAVIVKIRATQQAFIVRPVVKRAEGIVDGDEAPARADILP